MAVICLAFLLFGLLALGDAGHFMIWLSLIGAIAFGWPALHCFGLALRKPVALRMDAKGISGYYITPALWDEIAEIGTYSQTAGALRHSGETVRFLGFRLHDPVGFRDQQTAWERLRSWSSGRGVGYHLVIPGTALDNDNLDALAAQAEVFMAEARR